MKKKLIVLSLLICCAAAFSETGAEIKLNESVITGTGFDTTQRHQIKNITVINKEDIQNKGYNSVEEVLQKAPGVNIIHNGFGMVADIRGQGNEEAVKRVKILVDGIPMNILDLSHGLVPMNTIPVNRIEKIEIINGGGSVLYGSGTAGGVINIITNRTQREKIIGRVYYQNSSFATNKVGFDTGIKLTDNFLVDLGYEYINGNAYRRKEDSESNAFRGGFTYNINENQTLKFAASKYKQYYNETAYLTYDKVKADRRQANLDDITGGRLDRKDFSLNYTIKATDNLKFDLTGFSQKTRRVYEKIGNTSSYKIFTDGLFEDEKLGANLKGEYSYNEGLLTFGYDYTDNDGRRRAINSYTIVTPRMTINAGSETFIDLEKKTHSLFALNRHSWTDRLESTIGYRYEYSKYDVARKVYSVFNGTRTISGDIDTKKSKNNHAYEVGLNYKYSDTGNIYGKYERGFRSPGPTELVDKRAGGNYVLNNVKPEIYDTFEIGIKDIIGNSFVSATAFFTKTDDEIYTIFGSGGHGTSWTVENIQQTERKGLELFAEQYFDKFRINESLTYINAEISKGRKKGDKIPYVSKYKASLGANYDISSEFVLNSNLNYYSAPKDDGNNRLRSRVTMDIGATYKHESGIGIQAGIKNLFGKKYYKYESLINDNYLVAPERTYYVGISYDF